MIPQRIIDYLQGRGIPFQRHVHPRAVSAQEVAASIHVTGFRVAKSVVVQAGDKVYLAVVPAAELLDVDRLAEAVGAESAQLVDEAEFGRLFPDCEVGAEPPFGGLYGLPVVADQPLTEDESVIFRAGSHEETLEMRFADFRNLEQPTIASIGRPFTEIPRQAPPEARV